MRNYAQYTTSLYRDPDFRALTFEQQGVYLMLGMQPEVSAAGLLPLTIGRWSNFAADCTRDKLEGLLSDLGECAGRHILIDADTEELLIRKFIKWDRGWYNEKRAPVVAEAILSIASVHIRDIAVDELRRLIPSHALSDKAMGALSPALSRTPSRLDRSDDLDLGPTPLTLNPNPQPGAAALVASDAPRRDPNRCEKHQGVDIPGPCGQCKDAREAEQRRVAAALEAEVAAKKARAAAIAACELCDEFGRLVKNGQIVSKVCDCWYTEPNPPVAGFGGSQEPAGEAS